MSTFNYEYRLYQGTYGLEKAQHIGYGISVIDKSLKKEILCIEDITVSKPKMLKFIKTCNKLYLSPVHIHDAVSDFI